MSKQIVNNNLSQELTSTNLMDFRISFLNSEEFHHIKQEIWKRKIYNFESKNESPIIIDAGAHIGLASLYFKHIFPDAKIVAIEPNPINFEILEININQNSITDIRSINCGLSSNGGNKQLYIDSSFRKWFSTGSFQQKAWNKTQDTKAIEIPTKTLDEAIHFAVTQFKSKKINLIKMDIEGAEQAVLKNSKLLNIVDSIYIEYHPTKDQDLVILTNKLKKSGYRVEIEENGKEKGLKLLYCKRT